MELIYGKKPIKELLIHRPERIRELYLLEGDERQEFLQSVKQTTILVKHATKEELDRLCAAGKGGAEHQGVVAVLAGRNECTLEELIKYCKNTGTAQRLVVLDQIVDPHNIGAIFRGADASGVCGVILTTDRTCPITPVVRKVSMGATELLKTCFVVNLQRALRELKAQGFWIIGTDLSDNANDLYQTELPSPQAIVFGREEKGLRQLTAKECDLLVKIPLSGRVQSLNVSQAAAIILFELARREKQGKA